MSKLECYAIATVCPSVIGLVVAGYVSTSAVYGQAMGFQSTDLHQLKAVGDIQMSPNEDVILYSITTRLGNGRPSSEIWAHDLRTGSDRHFSVVQVLEHGGQRMDLELLTLVN